MESVTARTHNNFISQKVNAISPSGIRRFFDLLSSIEGVISLGVGEPDFVTPWHIREAAIHSLEKGYTMYTSNYGLLELRQELARYLERQYGVSYHPEQELIITTGVSEGLDIALRAIIDPGDEVIVPDPCYVAYIPDIVMAGGIPIEIPTYQKSNFAISAHDIESKISERTKAILIGYPSNPTGTTLSREELSAIAELARKYNLLVISDEIYSRLTYDSNHTYFASLPGVKDQTISLNGFSKSYAMTGWRIGYVAANRDIIEAMLKVHQYTMLCAPIMAQLAAIEALKSGEGEIEHMRQEYDKRRRVITKGFNNIGLTCPTPQGAFYAFPGIEITGMSSEEFAEKLLIEEKVAVIPGSVFGKHGEGFLRCCYATSLSDIKEAITRMDKFVRRHRKS